MRQRILPLPGDSLMLERLLGGTLVAAPTLSPRWSSPTLFKDRMAPVMTLGYHLFDAAVGGVLEYPVMLLGATKPYLIAALAYVPIWPITEPGRTDAAPSLAGEVLARPRT